MSLYSTTRTFALALVFQIALFTRPFPSEAKGTVIDDPRAIIILPAEMSTESTYPVVLSMRSDGDGRAAAELWASIGEKRGWIVVGSKDCRNDSPFAELLPKLEALLKDVQKRYPADLSRLILSGYAGGAMAAHGLVFSHPEWSAGLVVTNGMIHSSFTRQILAYPKGKWAVFLASPGHFRYQEMKQDRAFLEGLQWQTEWIDFEGGKMPAPPAAYEQAARWLDERMPRPVIKQDSGAVLPSAASKAKLDEKAAEVPAGKSQEKNKGSGKPD
jgi:predicted esterase